MLSSGPKLRRAAALVATLGILGAVPARAQQAAPQEAARPDEAAQVAVSEVAPNAWVDAAAKAFDVFPIRLLSTCATIVGFGAFLVSVPLVAPAGRMEAIRGSWDYFVIGPVDYTFVRPLGDF